MQGLSEACWARSTLAASPAAVVAWALRESRYPLMMQGMKRGRLSATFCLAGVLAGAALPACGDDDDKTSGRSSRPTLDAGRALDAGGGGSPVAGGVRGRDAGAAAPRDAGASPVLDAGGPGGSDAGAPLALDDNQILYAAD